MERRLKVSLKIETIFIKIHKITKIKFFKFKGDAGKKHEFHQVRDQRAKNLSKIYQFFNKKNYFVYIGDRKSTTFERHERVTSNFRDRDKERV